MRINSVFIFFQNEAYPTLKYKGVHFGNLTEKRLEFKPQEGPGPAHYDIIPYVIQPVL